MKSSLRLDPTSLFYDSQDTQTRATLVGWLEGSWWDLAVAMRMRHSDLLPWVSVKDGWPQLLTFRTHSHTYLETTLPQAAPSQ